MTTPSVTLRSLKNTETGIDISVPSFQEEEAPLGGISILYEVSVLTTLDLYKTRLHRDEDVVHFSIFKAHREIEDLSIKLRKKYPNALLPQVPKASLADKLSSNEKVKSFHSFMNALGKDAELCNSSIFTQFIGINSQRSSFKVSNTETTNSEAVSLDQDEKELFHKMKNIDKKPIKLVESKPALKSDLFEGNKSKTTVKGATSQSLFEEFDDDDLFSSKPAEKKSVQPKQSTGVKKVETPVPKKPIAKPTPDEIDDSEIIIKDRKLGEVSLFEEQDLGDYITKEEEALFMVTTPSSKTKQNFLLASKNEILSPEKEIDENDNLDDLLNLEFLPVSPREEMPAKKDVAKESEPSVPHKPVPLPRKKSITTTESEVASKPEVMPRKVFLNKNEDVPKSSAAAPPSVPPKPSLPATKPKPPVKPKPPPKKPSLAKGNEANNPTDLDTENANKPEENDNALRSVSNLSAQLKELDILKYIEQEQKSLDSSLDLFD